MVTKRQCGASLPYTKTFFPNFIFSLQSDTTLLAKERFGPIKNCDPRASGFLCGLLNLECPAASASKLGQAPCQHYCMEIANITRCANIFTVSQINLITDVCPFMPNVPVDDNPDFCTYKEPSDPMRKSFLVLVKLSKMESILSVHLTTVPKIGTC